MFKLIIPLIVKEVDRLYDISRLWENTISSKEYKLIDSIVFSFDYIAPDKYQEYKGICAKLFQAFGKVEVYNSNIAKNENVYVRDISSVPKDFKIPKLGYKSGPNTQFFRTMQANITNNQFAWAFYCETDCYPLKSRWISRLYETCLLNKNALILGSLYQGTSRLSAEINFHLNGNALYNLSKHSKAQFLYNLLEKFILLETAEGYNNIAYDVAFEILKHKITQPMHRNKLKKQMQLSEQEIRILASKVRPTDLIVNKAGKEELVSSSKPSLKDTIELVNAGAVLVHSPKYLEIVIQDRGSHHEPN